VSEAAFALDLDRVEALLPRYAVEGPRYTSYPTAPVWKETYGPEQYRAELGRAEIDPAEGLSCYVHVPFCDSLCHYCACNRVITQDPEFPERFLDVIEQEVAAVRDALRVPRLVTQHHWGGGTPTHLTPDQVRRLFHIVTGAFPLAEGAEISRVQEAVHRIQPVDLTAALVESSRRAGFESVNFDLIYGLPYQTEETFARTLDAVLALDPDRIALYSYAHVTWVAKQQRGFERKDLPDARTKARVMLGAIRRFLEAGYRFIGLDHFAKPEDELSRAVQERTLRRNFMGYTTQAGVELLGFGPSSISELRGSYAQSRRELEAWQEAVEAGGLATLRGHMLSRDDIERRWVIGRIMCHGELRAAEFEQAFGRPFAEAYAPELATLEPAIGDGLVTRAGDGSLTVTPLGRLLVRNVAMAFDAYLPEQQKAGRPMFSRTV
jgi:oxygen-independent coproporphyrinogen-3 oxidase